MEQTVQKKNPLIVVIIILSLALVGTISFTIYDKLIKKDVDNSNNQVSNTSNNTANTACKQQTIIDEKSYVLEAYNKRVSWNLPKSLIQVEAEKNVVITNEAILPKLNIDTANAKKFNSKIMNDYKYVTDIIDTKKLEADYDYLTGRRINYDYFINGDIILIMINYDEGTYRGGSDETAKGYYYDIKNDKELSVKEVCEKLEITLDKINKKINLQVYSDERTPLTSLDQILAIKQNSSLNSFTIYYNGEVYLTNVIVDTIFG